MKIIIMTGTPWKTTKRICATNLGLLIMFSGSGCMMTTGGRPQEYVSAPPVQAPQTDATRPDTLSYGMVTGKVKKNETTQHDLLELFGGPSTMTTDRDGTEVWMYDKTATTTSGSYASSESSAQQSEAAVMAGFFGLPIPGIVGGGASASRSETAAARQGNSFVSRSVKTITFIVKFNEDNTVKDFAVRQASY